MHDAIGAALGASFAKQLKTPAASVTTKVVRAILNAIADDGRRAIARLTGAYGRAAYGWAIHADLIDVNPFIGIRLVEAVASRERVLSDAELRAIWQTPVGSVPHKHNVRAA